MTSYESYANILSGASQGASSALKSSTEYANSKREAKEAKRRTLANLLNNAFNRNQKLFRAGQDYQDDLSDYKSQAMQQVARGFVEALQGGR